MALQELLQLGESYHQEFKETIDKSSDLLHRMGYIEKIGTGIKSIRDAVAETTNCSVKFEIDEHWFTTVFYRNKLQSAKSSDISSDITSANILELLKFTPILSAHQLSELMRI